MSGKPIKKRSGPSTALFYEEVNLMVKDIIIEQKRRVADWAQPFKQLPDDLWFQPFKERS
ncbi:hypothetical protein BSG1_16805 [Bacillus sp. SG-1]|nr:hypothetical protein BSG1_16805 [Bacillus sp. SG-1]